MKQKTQLMMIAWCAFSLATAAPAQTIQKKLSRSEIARTYLHAVFNEHHFAKAAQYIDHNKMIQHNPFVPNGFHSLVAYVQSPEGKHITVETGLTMEKGDLVMMHNRYKSPQGNTIAVDIFRVKNGKVVEHWDVVQEEVSAKKSANGHAMFPAK